MGLTLISLFVGFGIILPWALVFWLFASDQRPWSVHILSEGESLPSENLSPACDMCAVELGSTPTKPTRRCMNCMFKMNHTLGDPLAGFDFTKHGDPYYGSQDTN